MRTLGIDPGTARMGWGCVELVAGVPHLIAVGVLTTEAKVPQSERLLQLYDGLCALIIAHKPTEAAIEELFFGKNVNTAITVGQARGVALLALAKAQLPVAEYKPAEVKQAIAGYGNADKRQMQEMVRVTLKLAQVPKPDDAADALAIALCHSFIAPTLRRMAGR